MEGKGMGGQGGRERQGTGKEKGKAGGEGKEKVHGRFKTLAVL